jgi:hypothetical protein
MVPLLGQGKPLPDYCAYDGEWLHENKLFLYRADHAMTVEFTAGFLRTDGEWCLGFNAATLASLLGIGSDEVFEHNRNGTLILDDVRPVPAPQREGAVANEYVFRVGNKAAGFVVETGPEGRA